LSAITVKSKKQRVLKWKFTLGGEKERDMDGEANEKVQENGIY